MKAICVDDAGFARGVLTKGNVYDVKDDGGPDYDVVVNAKPWSFAKRRFQLVAEEAPKPSLPVQATTPTIEDKSTTWQAWRNSTPGECACGTNKSACWIHRDM